MGSFRVPADAFVWSSEGPRCVGDLVFPAALAMVNRRGRVMTSNLVSVGEATEQQVIRLFTSAGDLLLEPRAAITTRDGRLFADAAAQRVKDGGRIRIELAHPRDLPVRTDSASHRAAARAALSLLDPPVVRVPRGLGLETELLGILLAADVAHVDASDERWTAFVFDGTDLSHSPDTIGAAEAEILTLLTAWTIEQEVVVSRTTMTQLVLRQRLLADLAAIGKPGMVSWVPGYGPVEARVTPASSVSFASCGSSLLERASCVRVVTEDEGALIVNLAVVTGRDDREP